MPESGLRRRLGLERSVAALAAALLLFGFGQELWARYLPEYLRLFGASVFTVGLFGSLQDLLDAAYAYPGGWLSDRLGSRRALLLFAAITTAGFASYLVSRSVAAIFAGAFLVAAWRSLALPATFALIGEELTGGRRLVGFTVQSVVKRIPVVLAPPLGGLLLERFGLREGMRLGFAVSVVLAIGMVAALGKAFRREGRDRGTLLSLSPRERVGVRAALPRGEKEKKPLHPALRRLLVADCLIRFCEGLPSIFLVLWALETVRISPFQFGALQSILMGTAILSYLPAAALSDRLERKPFVVATFLFFTLFPLAVGLSSCFAHLAAAYVLGGLREIGEPARKALSVDLAGEEGRGRAVGLYYA
ncbi:MAG: MFS transporter, partial [Thermoanaerobaculia bacterium]